MKKLSILVVILVFYTTSCTSDDDANKVTQKLFKKIERYDGGLFFDTTLNYNSNNQIESMITNKYKPAGLAFERVISVAYVGNSVATIRDVIDYASSTNSPDEDISYDVSTEGNLIYLTSDDFRIEIAHSNGYVDSLKKVFLENMFVARESYLTRDSNQNLTSYAFSGSVVNNYSDFDTDKKVDPRGIVIDVAYRNYISIFNLKLTKNNPRTSRQDILTSVGRSRTYLYEYDDEGYIIKTYDPDGLSYVNTFYIEQ